MRDAIRYTLIAAVAFCASLAAAADVTKRIDVAPGPVELRIDKPASSDYLIRWDARQPLDIQSLGPYESRTVMVVNAQPPGAQLVIDAEVIDWVAKIPTTTRFIINVGGTPPPPDPKPDPKPDDPKPPRPDTDKAPLPDMPGFYVLMVYESGTLPPDIPKEQHEIPYLPTVRDWLTKNTTPSNNWAGWRVGDPEAGVSQGSDLWNRMLGVYSDAAAFPGRSTPWLVVSNGAKNRGYSGPMPKNASEFLALLETLK